MKVRIRKFKDISGIEFILLRDKFGLKKYRKRRVRDFKKKKILLDLAIKKIEDKERNDFIPVGYRKRKVNMPTVS